MRYAVKPALKRLLSGKENGTVFAAAPESGLVEGARRFWFSSEKPEIFEIEGEKISRKDIFERGGPDRRIQCQVCQRIEWLSRVKKKNLFSAHGCAEEAKTRGLCESQEDDRSAHLHQNFNFALGISEDIHIPKCISIATDYIFDRLQRRNLDTWSLVWQRILANSCQYDLVKNPKGVDWKKYDIALFFDPDKISVRFERPRLPIIMFGHDFWDPEEYHQWIINWLKPDVLATVYPYEWKTRFRFPKKTEIFFTPFFDTTFFARPNLSDKKYDLVAAGPIDRSFDDDRKELDKDLRSLPEKYTVEFKYASSSGIQRMERPDPSLNALNKWSETLGEARFAVFGGMKYKILVQKYFEVLGSGAVPILPEVPDIELLGIKPFVHYLPLGEKEGRRERLIGYLENYEKYKHIAEKAVAWYKTNSDKMTFSDFAGLILRMTKNKYTGAEL